MLFKRKAKEPNPIELERNRVLEKMKTLDPDSPEYTKMLVAVNRLHAMLPPEREKRGVSMDTAANLLAYLGNTMMVLHHEKLNVVTSKVFGAKPPRP